MGGQGAFVKNLTAEYLPAYGSQTLHAKVTTAVNTVQRLGTLNTTPQIPDETHTLVSGATPTRPPWHLILQVPLSAANPVYLTWDNNTAPVVGGPGFELAPGATLKFEHAEALLSPKSGAPYVVNALSSIQVIAVAATALLITYTD